jgi:anti-sigma-K factor RskA
MSDLTEIDALAVDYVLGQLNPAERQAVSARLLRDAALADAVAGWERRLAPLNELTPAVAPPDHLFAAIEARVMAMNLAHSSVDGSAQVIDLTARLRRWRTVAALTGALAASLVVFTAVREVRQPQNFVAVLQKDAASPAFILTVDLAAKSFNVRSVSAEPQPDKSYELWLVSDKFPAPKSLGLLGQGALDARRSLAPYDPVLVSNATFAVSLEPKGGSPSGLPTGPVVYAGKLIQAPP